MLNRAVAFVYASFLKISPDTVLVLIITYLRPKSKPKHVKNSERLVNNLEMLFLV